MIRFKIQSIAGGITNLAGATLAAKHLKKLLSEVRPRAGAQEEPPEVVLVDFEGIESATGSYLKGLLLPPLKDCLGAGVPPGGYPVVIGLNDEVRSELVDVLTLNKMTCLEAVQVEAGRIVQARVLGTLDPALADTLKRVVAIKTATATQLHSEARDRITVTAWNNRLSDLHGRAVVRRRRAGKQWVYEPLGEEIQNG